jgi:4-hydroxybenzoate polyprenyltransferase
VYIVNDLCDLPADRRHHRKKFRPFAAGIVPISQVVLLLPMLLGIAAALTLLLPIEFGLALLCYLLVTSLYSFSLKRAAVVDVLTLASLYTLRIFAGALAAGVIISQWFFAFSMFFFLSLAAVKRYSELEALQRSTGESGETLAELRAPGRGYSTGDLPLLMAMGVSSAYLSVLVLALYVSADEALIYYKAPELLWLFCLIFLYWLSRVWLLTQRGQMHEDPIVFALRDRVSYLLGAVALIIFLFARSGF